MLIFRVCQTRENRMSAFNNGNFADPKRVKTDIPEEEQPSLIINQARFHHGHPSYKGKWVEVPNFEAWNYG